MRLIPAAEQSPAFPVLIQLDRPVQPITLVAPPAEGSKVNFWVYLDIFELDAWFVCLASVLGVALGYWAMRRAGVEQFHRQRFVTNKPRSSQLICQTVNCG